MNLALFDFDGTITNSESFGPFLRLATSPTRRAVGSVLLAPLVLSYRAGLISGVTVRAAVVKYALRGMDERVVRKAGQEFSESEIPSTIRAEAWARIQWHREQGDTIVVVSGALDVYLQPWCAKHGFGLLCSRLQVRDGKLTGSYAGSQCVGEEKARLAELHYPRADFREVYAYGDTKEDFAMLRKADHRFFRGRTWADRDTLAEGLS